MQIPTDRWAEAARLLAGGRYRQAHRLLTPPPEPDDAVGLGLLGRALIGLHQYPAARQQIMAALALSPDDPALRFDLARALNGLGLMHAAVPILAALHADDPENAAVTEMLANALRRDARYEDAVALADAEAAAGRLDKGVRYHRALSRLYLSEPAAALADFDLIVAEDPGHGAAWFASHACLIGDQGLEAACHRLRRAVASPGANRKYAGFLAAYEVLTGGSAAGAAPAPILDGVLALVADMAPDCRIFGVSADLLRFALSRAVGAGLVLEFGVRRGTSLRHIAAAAGQHVHGFDSFTGLPEGWGNELAGTFALAEGDGVTLPTMPDNVSLHPGWFDQVLPGFLAAHAGPVRLVNIDCDIYSSTVTVLNALAGRLVAGSVLVFDEFIGNRTWADHEFKAFGEFAARTGRRFQHIAISPYTGQVALMLLD